MTLSYRGLSSAACLFQRGLIDSAPPAVLKRTPVAALMELPVLGPGFVRVPGNERSVSLPGRSFLAHPPVNCFAAKAGKPVCHNGRPRPSCRHRLLFLYSSCLKTAAAKSRLGRLHATTPTRLPSRWIELQRNREGPTCFIMEVGRPLARPLDDQRRLCRSMYERIVFRRSEVRAELLSGVGAAVQQAGYPVVTSNQTSFKVTLGTASPLGASKVENGVNFALFSQHATAVTLCLFLDPNNSEVSTQEIFLDPLKQRTGSVWHACVENLPVTGVSYGYRVDGPQGWEKGHRFDKNNILLDPYAKHVNSRLIFGDVKHRNTKFLGTYDFSSYSFDWGKDYQLPALAENDLVIYEMNVRAFTMDESSGLDSAVRGSYLGVIEKIPHLVELGVNAVELLPVFEFDELEFQRRPNPREHLVNTWGYSTINFFAPMSRYASNRGGPLAAAKEFKQMVKAFHTAGIEVILDVVYNHTNEADDEFPFTTSFRGIDNLVYYMVDTTSYVQLQNFSGCGNTLNCNHPVVMELVLDSLRHWVTEYHVDGFRFDLASILCRGTDGSPLAAPPVIRAIAKDPVLSRCKLIAEPWDCGGLYQVGSFPNWDRWSEWNGKYRDDVRKFIKGDQGMKSAFATRLSGSADLYQKNKRAPYHSINFIIAHDGFSLYDLVAYNTKHNDANGEGGNDGSNDNFSWNCGAEGDTIDPDVNALRGRQMKNFQLALMVSQGVPMMLMGDEYGHTRHGNNNSYGHDTAINHFQWSKLKDEKSEQFRFFSESIKFRRRHPLLGRDCFLTDADITWHETDWDNQESRFLAFSMHEGSFGGGDLYVAFNAHSYFVKIILPAAPPGKRWYRVVDTNLAPPADFVESGVCGLEAVYMIAPFSAILLHAKP